MLDKRRATAVTAVLSVVLRFPIGRSAMLTDFFTKFRASVAACSISASPCTNFASLARLSCTERLHSNANAVRFSNSPRRLLHATTLLHACGVRSKRLKDIASQNTQLSNSLHQRSICAAVMRAGSPTNDASIRASYARVPKCDRKCLIAAERLVRCSRVRVDANLRPQSLRDGRSTRPM